MSNLWESIGDTLDSLGGAVAAPIGAAWDLSTMVFDDEPVTFGKVVKKMSGRAEDVLDPILNPETLSGLAFGKTMQGLEYLYREEISEPLVTANTMLGHLRYSPENWTDIFSGEVWGEAYEVAQNRSIGQSIYLSNPLQFGQPTNIYNEGALDPLDKRAYKQALKNDGWQATLVSGTYDFAARWYLDPGILIGKGAMALRAAQQTRKITFKDMPTGSLSADAFEKVNGFRPFAWFQKDPLGNRTADYLDWINTGANGKPLTGPQVFIGSPELKRSTRGQQIAELLADAARITDPAARATAQRRILAASWGDAKAIRGIETDLAHSKWIADGLKNIAADNVLDLKAHAAVGDQILANPHLLARLNGQLDNLPAASKAVEDHIKKLDILLDTQASLGYAPARRAAGVRALAREEGHGLLRDGRMNTGHGFPDKPAAWVAERVAHLATNPSITSIYQWSPVHVPLKIITPIGKALMWPYLRLPVKMSDALRTPHLQGFISTEDWNGAALQLDSMMKLANVAPADRWKALSTAHLARTEAEKIAAVTDVERLSARAIVAKHGAKAQEDLDNADNLQGFIDEVMAAGHAKRAAHLAAFYGRAYAATKNQWDDAGLRVDQIMSRGNLLDDVDGVPVALPLVETQGANILPLWDAALFDKMMSRQYSRLNTMARAWGDNYTEIAKLTRLKARTGKNIEGALQHLHDAQDWLVRAGTLLMRGWKMSVLFRLGYPLRVVADDHMRIYSQIGFAAIMGSLARETLGNLWYNRAPALFAKGATEESWRYTRRKAVMDGLMRDRARLAQIEELVTPEQVAAYAERKAQITSLNRKIAAGEWALRRNTEKVTSARVWPNDAEHAFDIDIVDYRYIQDEWLPKFFGEPSRRESDYRHVYNPRLHGGQEPPKGKGNRGNGDGFVEGPPQWAILEDDDVIMHPIFKGKTEPITHVYRAVTEEEWQEAVERGYLKSDGRGALIPEWEGTNAGVESSTAWHYMPRNGTARVLKIEVRDGDGWFTSDADNYLRTRGRIPLDRVMAKTPAVERREGHMLPPAGWKTAQDLRDRVAMQRDQRDYFLANLGDDPEDLLREQEDLKAFIRMGWSAQKKLVPKRRLGEKDFVVDGTRYPGSMSGELGAAWRLSTSSGATWDNMGKVGEEAGVNMPTRQGGYRVILGNEDVQPVAWADVLNNQFRQSKLAMWFIKNDDSATEDNAFDVIDDFVAWLNEPEQALLRKRLPHFAHDPEDWGWRIKQMVDDYLPTAELREMVRKGRVTPTQLSRKFADASQRPAVHGATIRENLGEQSHHQLGIGKALSNAFKYLGQLPTDTLSRQPYFNAVYKAEVRRLHRLRMADANATGSVFTQADIDKITDMARRNALGDLKRTLFDISAHSNAAHAMRFVSPFFAAQQEALMRWWRIVADDPSVLRRFQQGFDIPRHLGLVVDRETGEPVQPGEMPGPGHSIMIQVPEAWGGSNTALGKWFNEKAAGWTINENSLNLVLQNGLFNPGMGPFVQIPVEAIVLEYAEFEELSRIARLINPYPPESLQALVMPATLRRLDTIIKKEKSTEYARMFKINFDDRLTDWKLANGDAREPTQAEMARIEEDARNETNLEAGLRFLQNFFSPAPAAPRSKYEVFRQGWRKIMDQMRAEGRDYDWAIDEFKRKYREAYLPMISSSFRNPGAIPATNEAVAELKRHRKLIDKVDIRFAGAIIGSAGKYESAEDYNDTAAKWLRDNLHRNSEKTYYTYDDPRAAVVEAAQKRGWNKYSTAMDSLNVLAQAAGFQHYSQSDKLMLLKRRFIDNLREENIYWGEDYDDFNPGEFNAYLDDLRMIVADKGLRDREDVKKVADYLALRDIFLAELARRDQAGGSASPTAKANQELMGKYRDLVAMLTESNLDFEEYWYNGLLDRDPMLEEVFFKSDILATPAPVAESTAPSGGARGIMGSPGPGIEDGGRKRTRPRDREVSEADGKFNPDATLDGSQVKAAGPDYDATEDNYAARMYDQTSQSWWATKRSADERGVPFDVPHPDMSDFMGKSLAELKAIHWRLTREYSRAVDVAEDED